MSHWYWWHLANLRKLFKFNLSFIQAPTKVGFNSKLFSNEKRKKYALTFIKEVKNTRCYFHHWWYFLMKWSEIKNKNWNLQQKISRNETLVEDCYFQSGLCLERAKDFVHFFSIYSLIKTQIFSRNAVLRASQLWSFIAGKDKVWLRLSNIYTTRDEPTFQNGEKYFNRWKPTNQIKTMIVDLKFWKTTSQLLKVTKIDLILRNNSKMLFALWWVGRKLLQFECFDLKSLCHQEEY